MDMNRYNTRVRHAMNNAYIKSGKKIHELHIKLESIYQELKTGQTTLTYSAYTNLEKEYLRIEREFENEKLKRDVWRDAREICMKIADEEECEKQERLDIATKGMLDMFSEMFPGL